MPYDPLAQAEADQQRAERAAATAQQQAQRNAERAAAKAAHDAEVAQRKQEQTALEANYRAQGMTPWTGADGNLYPDPLHEQKQADAAQKEQQQAAQAAAALSAKQQRAEAIRSGRKNAINPVDGTPIYLESPEQLEARRRDEAEKIRQSHIDDQIRAAEAEYGATTAQQQLQGLKPLSETARKNLTEKVLSKAKQDARFALQSHYQTLSGQKSGTSDWIPFNEAATPEATAAAEQLKRLQTQDADLTEEDLATLAGNDATKPLATRIQNIQGILSKDAELQKSQAQHAARLADLKLRRDAPDKWAESVRARRAALPPEELQKDLETSRADLETRAAALQQQATTLNAQVAQHTTTLDQLAQQAAQRRQQGIPAGEIVSYTAEDGSTEHWPRDLATQREAALARLQDTHSQQASSWAQIEVQQQELQREHDLHNQSADHLKTTVAAQAAQQKQADFSQLKFTPGHEQTAQELASIDADAKTRLEALNTQYQGQPPAEALAALQQDVQQRSQSALAMGESRRLAAQAAYAGIQTQLQQFQSDPNKKGDVGDLWINARKNLSEALSIPEDKAMQLLEDVEAEFGWDKFMGRFQEEDPKGQWKSWKNALNDDSDPRKTRVLSTGGIVVNPAITDEAKYKAAVDASPATPEAKAAAMARYPARRQQAGQRVLDTIQEIEGVFGKKDMQDWYTFLKARPEGVSEQDWAVKFAEKTKADSAASPFSSLFKQVIRSGAQGVNDLRQQASGLIAGLTGSETAMQDAQWAARKANALELTKELDATTSNNFATRGLFDQLPRLAGSILPAAGGAKVAQSGIRLFTTTSLGARLLPSLSAALQSSATPAQAVSAVQTLTRAGVGGTAAAGALQTYGAQMADIYGTLRRENPDLTHEQALAAAQQPAILSAGVTALLTTVGGARGVEKFLANPSAAKDLFKKQFTSQLQRAGFIGTSVAEGAAKEWLEEIPDEFFSQYQAAVASHPNDPQAGVKAIAQFMDQLPELSVAIGVMGGLGEGISDFQGTSIQSPASSNPANLPETVAAAEAAIQNHRHLDASGTEIPALTQATQTRAALALATARGGDLADATEQQLNAAGWTRRDSQGRDMPPGKFSRLKDYTGPNVLNIDTNGTAQLDPQYLTALKEKLPAVAAAIPTTPPLPPTPTPIRSNDAATPTANNSPTTSQSGNPPAGQTPADRSSPNANPIPVQAPAQSGTEPPPSGSTPPQSGTPVTANEESAATPARSSTVVPTTEQSIADWLVDRHMPDAEAAAAAKAITAHPDMAGKDFDHFARQITARDAVLQSLNITGSTAKSKAATNPLRYQSEANPTRSESATEPLRPQGNRVSRPRSESAVNSESFTPNLLPASVQAALDDSIPGTPSQEVFTAIKQAVQAKELTEQDATTLVAQQSGALDHTELRQSLENRLGWNTPRANTAAALHFGDKSQSPIPLAAADRDAPTNLPPSGNPASSIQQPVTSAAPSLTQNADYARAKLTALSRITDAAKKSWARQFFTLFEKSFEQHHLLYDAIATGPAARQRLGGQFTAVMSIDGQITRLIDLDAMVGQFSHIETPAAAVRATGIEEDVHALVLQLARKNPQKYGYPALVKQWQALPDKLKQAVWQSYNASNLSTSGQPSSTIVNNGQPLSTNQEWHLMNEFLRMLVQDSHFAGQITEAVDAAPSLVQWVKDLLKDLGNILRSLLKDAPPALQSDIQSMVAELGQRLKDIEKASATSTARLETIPTLADTQGVTSQALTTLLRNGQGILSPEALARIWDQLDPALHSRVFQHFRNKTTANNRQPSPTTANSRRAPKHELMQELLTLLLTDPAAAQSLLESPPKTPNLLTKLFSSLQRIAGPTPQGEGVSRPPQPSANPQLAALHAQTLRLLSTLASTQFVQSLPPTVTQAVTTAPPAIAAQILATRSASDNLTRPPTPTRSESPTPQGEGVSRPPQTLHPRAADFLAALEAAEKDHTDAALDTDQSKLRAKLRLQEVAATRTRFFLRDNAAREQYLATQAGRQDVEKAIALQDLALGRIGARRPASAWRTLGLTERRRLALLGIGVDQHPSGDQGGYPYSLSRIEAAELLLEFSLAGTPESQMARDELDWMRQQPADYQTALDPLAPAYVERDHILIKQSTLDDLALSYPHTTALIHPEWQIRQSYGLRTDARLAAGRSTPGNAVPASAGSGISATTQQPELPTPQGEGVSRPPQTSGSGQPPPTTANAAQQPQPSPTPRPAKPITFDVPVKGEGTITATFPDTASREAFQFKHDLARSRKLTSGSERTALETSLSALKARFMADLGLGDDAVTTKLAAYHEHVVAAAADHASKNRIGGITAPQFESFSGGRSAPSTKSLPAPVGGDLISDLARYGIGRISSTAQPGKAGDMDWFKSVTDGTAGPHKQNALILAVKAADAGELTTPLARRIWLAGTAGLGLTPAQARWERPGHVLAPNGMAIDAAASTLSSQQADGSGTPYQFESGDALGLAILEALDSRIAAKGQSADPTLSAEADAQEQSRNFATLLSGNQDQGQSMTGSEIAAALDPDSAAENTLKLGTAWFTVDSSDDTGLHLTASGPDADLYGSQTLAPDQSYPVTQINDTPLGSSSSSSSQRSDFAKYQASIAELIAAVAEDTSLGAAHRIPPEQIAQAKAEMAENATDENYQGGNAWLTLDNKWVNLGEDSHLTASTIVMTEGYGPAMAAGYVRVVTETYASGSREIYAEFFGPLTRRIIRNIRDAALLRGINPDNVHFEPNAEEYYGNPEEDPKLAAAPRTPTFLQWFGNSKVTHLNGQPRIVYHGTESSFDSFTPTAGRHGNPKFPHWAFTDSSSVAESYAIGTDPKHFAPDGMLQGDTPTGANIMPVYLSLQHPLIVDAQGESWDQIPYNNKQWSTDDLAAEARTQGYDGLIVHNVQDSAADDSPPATSYFAFNPEQIKSAYNHGKWDANSSNILAASNRTRLAAASFVEDAIDTHGLRTFTDLLRQAAQDLPAAVFTKLRFPHFRSAWNTVMAERGLPEVSREEEQTALRTSGPQIERRFGEPPPDLRRRLESINEDDMSFPVAVPTTPTPPAAAAPSQLPEEGQIDFWNTSHDDYRLETREVPEGSPMTALAIKAIAPYLISGNKGDLLGRHGTFYLSLADQAPVVLDAFGGAAIYTHFLAQQGSLPAGSTWNEWEYSRSITNRQIKDQPAAVVRDIISLRNNYDAAFPVTEAALTREDTLRLRSRIFEWVNQRLQTSLPSPERDAMGRLILPDTPQTAALYLFLQNHMVENRVVDFDIGPDGYPRLFTGGKPIGKDDLHFVRWNTVTNAMEHSRPSRIWGEGMPALIRDASRRFASATIRQGDGWQLAADAPAGALVFVDTSYFPTDEQTAAGSAVINYGNTTLGDANPALWFQKFEKYLLPKSNEVRYVITNNFNGRVVDQLEKAGWTVLRTYRGNPASPSHEFIALSPAAAADIRLPRAPTRRFAHGGIPLRGGPDNNADRGSTPDGRGLPAGESRQAGIRDPQSGLRTPSIDSALAGGPNWDATTSAQVSFELDQDLRAARDFENDLYASAPQIDDADLEDELSASADRYRPEAGDEDSQALPAAKRHPATGQLLAAAPRKRTKPFPNLKKPTLPAPTPRSELFGEWAVDIGTGQNWRMQGPSKLIGFRGVITEGKDNGFGNTEGNGIYLMRTRQEAAVFGKVQRISFPEPQSPFLVDDGNLYLLHESDELDLPIDPTQDSPWLQASKYAAQLAHNIGKGKWNAQLAGDILTKLLMESGYDSVYVKGAPDDWVTLLRLTRPNAQPLGPLPAAPRSPLSTLAESAVQGYLDLPNVAVPPSKQPTAKRAVRAAAAASTSPYTLPAAAGDSGNRDRLAGLRDRAQRDWNALVGKDAPAIRAAFQEKDSFSTLLHDFISRDIPSFNIQGAIIESPADFAAFNLATRSPYFESLKIALIDSANQVVHSQIVHVGGLNEAVADPKVIAGIIASARLQHPKTKFMGWMIAHNHPSGDPLPSEADRRVTRRFRDMGEFLGLPMLDHVITNGEKYFSFRETGMVGGELVDESIDQRATRSTKPKLPILPTPPRPAPGTLADWEIIPSGSGTTFDSPVKTFSYLDALRTADPDHYHVLYLDTKNGLRAVERLPTSLTTAQIFQRIVLGAAREGAYSFTFGFPAASDSASTVAENYDHHPVDHQRRLVRALREKSRNIGLDFTDAMTHSPTEYFSFAERGLMESPPQGEGVSRPPQTSGSPSFTANLLPASARSPLASSLAQASQTAQSFSASGQPPPTTANNGQPSPTPLLQAIDRIQDWYSSTSKADALEYLPQDLQQQIEADPRWLWLDSNAPSDDLPSPNWFPAPYHDLAQRFATLTAKAETDAGLTDDEEEEKDTALDKLYDWELDDGPRNHIIDSYQPDIDARLKSTIKAIEATGRWTWNPQDQTFESTDEDTTQVLYAAPRSVNPTRPISSPPSFTANLLPAPPTVREVFDHRLSVAKQEILQDIAAGTVPSTVGSWQDLQDHVDANEYVNDRDRPDRLIGLLGRSKGWTTPQYVGFTNHLITTLNNWLKSGRPPTPSGSASGIPLLLNSLAKNSAPKSLTSPPLAASPRIEATATALDRTVTTLGTTANLLPKAVGKVVQTITGTGQFIPGNQALAQLSTTLGQADAAAAAKVGTTVANALQRVSGKDIRKAPDAVAAWLNKPEGLGSWTKSVVVDQLLPTALMPREWLALSHEMQRKAAFGAEKSNDLIRALSGNPRLSDLAYPKEFAQNPAYREQLFDAMEGKIPMATLPPAMQALAAKLRALLRETGLELVSQGLMHPDTFEELQASGWMPRYMLEEAQESGGSILAAFKLGIQDLRQQRSTAFHIVDTTRKGKDGQYLTVNRREGGRNAWRFRDAATRDAFYSDFIRHQALDMLQETHGNTKEVQTMMAALDGQQRRQIRSQIKVLTRADMDTPQKLSPALAGMVKAAIEHQKSIYRKEAPFDPPKLIKDPVYAIARYVLAQTHNAATMELLSATAKNKEWTSNVALQGYTAIPDNDRFGPLAGKFVQADIAQQILDKLDVPNAALRFYDAILRKWKSGKLVWNPGSHIRDAVGNTVFAYLGGSNIFNPGNWPYYRQALDLMRGNVVPPLGGSGSSATTYAELLEHGVLGGDAYSSLVREKLKGLLPDAKTVENFNPGLLQRFFLDFGSKFHATHEQLAEYRRIPDDFYKIAAYLKAKATAQGDGVSDPVAVQKAAAAHVRKWFPYYDRLGGSATTRAAGRFINPFLSFFRESTRILGTAAAERPIALTAALAFPAAISALSAMLLGLDDRDRDEIERDLSGRGKGILGLSDLHLFSMLLPVRSGQGQVQQFDISAIMPFADLLGQKIVPLEEKENAWQTFWRQTAAAGPVGNLGVAWITNRDLFSGRHITEADMSASEMLRAYTQHAAGVALPPLAPDLAAAVGIGDGGALSRAGTRQVNKTLQTYDTTQTVIRALLGMNVKSAAPNIYRQADDFRKANGYDTQPDFDYGTTATSRAKRALVQQLAQDTPNPTAIKNLVNRLKEMGVPLDTPGAITKVLKIIDPASIIGGSKKQNLSAADARQRFRQSLPPESRALYEASLQEYQRIQQRAPALLRAAQ